MVLSSGVVLSSALPVVSMTCMTFDEVGAPPRLSGGPSPATNIPVVHTSLMPIQLTFDLEPEDPRKGMRRTGGLQRSSSSKSAQ